MAKQAKKGPAGSGASADRAKKAKNGLAGLKTNRNSVTFLALEVESDVAKGDTVRVLHPAANSTKEWTGSVMCVDRDPDDNSKYAATAKLTCIRSNIPAEQTGAEEVGRTVGDCRVTIAADPNPPTIKIDLYNN